MPSKTDRRIRGLKSDAKGLRFEQKVIGFFSNQGWRLQPRKRFQGVEFDLYGVKEDFLARSYLLVECKDTPKLSKAHAVRFMSKVRRFYESLPQDMMGTRPALTAVIAFSGIADNDSRVAANAFRPQIRLKKF